MNVIDERLNIAIHRIEEIKIEETVEAKYLDYFKKVSDFILDIYSIYNDITNGKFANKSLEELELINKKIYKDVAKDNYENSYANPTYAVNKLGGEFGKILCFLYVKTREIIPYIYDNSKEMITLKIELFIEIYNYFEDSKSLTEEIIKETIYSFEKDNTEVFTANNIEKSINVNDSRAVDIVMKSDLLDLRYLYYYGVHIGYNEIEIAKFLNNQSEEQINKMADVYTEGYRKGFVATGKDLSIKGSVSIHYFVGFERVIKRAIENFEKMGLKPVIYYGSFQSTNFNNQYSFDHKFDEALYLDKAYVKRKLEVIKETYENNKEIASLMAGPAVIEVFGETPFEPENKKESYSLSETQQKMQSDFIRKNRQIRQEYIKEEERSFTIIAFPIPEFGENFEEIFQETIKINTLDASKYEETQQNIINTLDKADYVRITGRGNNKTYMNVKLHNLKDPDKETNFENCVADVNIPLGEVFTSPKLKDTNGILHVTQVYLNGIKYKDLEIEFQDGMIKDYNCKNFETEEENKKFIKENILFNHDTLPIGEFAIGTNTTAYAMAKKYDVIYKLPILIVEKMGPHFAVGDTCYSFEEDIKTYNPDGKEIVARENEVSALRKTDIQKAYFSCHTDITIPYDELGDVIAVTKKGEEKHIIKGGKFVLKGTEFLNEVLE